MKAVTSVLSAILAIVLVGGVDLERVSAFTTTTTTTTNPTTTTRATVLLQATTRNNENDNDIQQKKKSSKKKMIMSKSQKENIMKTKLFGTAILSASLLFFSGILMVASPQPVHANNDGGSKVVGTLKGSGLVFKDTLNIERFEDPKVKGVVLYISNFERPVTEKLSKGNFFNDPSQASVACARTGTPVSIASNIAKGSDGEEVFKESRSLLFKTLRVQRVYDEDKK
jgi:catabolite regulation protein CreA